MPTDDYATAKAVAKEEQRTLALVLDLRFCKVMVARVSNTLKRVYIYYTCFHS